MLLESIDCRDENDGEDFSQCHSSPTKFAKSAAFDSNNNQIEAGCNNHHNDMAAAAEWQARETNGVVSAHSNSIHISHCPTLMTNYHSLAAAGNHRITMLKSEQPVGYNTR